MRLRKNPLAFGPDFDDLRRIGKAKPIRKASKTVRRWTRFQTISLFRVNEGSERVARGFAVGALINFFPTFGLGLFAAGFAAGLTGGNVIAGFVGGAIFVVLWPLLFVLNMQTGGLIYHSPIQVDDIDDVDERTIDALVMGKTFLSGAAVNCLVGGLLLYGLVYFAHRQFRGRILTWLNERRARRVERLLARRESNSSRERDNQSK